MLRRETEEIPEAGYLPVPGQVRLEGQYGRNVHALVYPPTHPDAVAPDGELPPYIVWAHGGPTSHVTGLLDLEKAYFTSRGIGVIDVNYGGSTGYGRSYRERLRMQWGVVDVEDAVAAALALADKDEADPAAPGDPGRVGGRLDGAGRGHHARGQAAGCSARRRPTSGWLTCASSRPRRTTSSRITWTA